MKKIISVILAVCLVFCSSIIVNAENADGLYYEQGEYKLHYTETLAENSIGRIMFIHGFLYSGRTWDYMIPYFVEAGYDCYAVDVVSFGYSTRESTVENHIDREDLIVGLMESIAPMDEWTIAGHSMGGSIAMNIAYDYPEIQNLLLYAPAFMTSVAPENNRMMNNAFTIAMCKFMLNVVRAMPFIATFGVYKVTDDWTYAKSYNASVLLDPLAVDGTMESICAMNETARGNKIEEIKALEMPILLVWATTDSVLPVASTNAISAALEGKAVEKTCEGNHLFIENKAQAAAQFALDFLA
ncbi:MAG TPA: alpha/beta hydrolase [Clostridiales bacterium]|nr:alpha/beta hydrolase [Clostridiales bacterium]